MVFQVDFTEWEQYTSIIENTRIELPRVQRVFLQELGEELTVVVSESALTRVTPGQRFPLSVSGAYAGSFDFMMFDDPEGLPSMLFGMLQGSEKLEIYWRAIELGTQPNPRVPTVNLMQWALAKFGDGQLGRAVATAIRRRGVRGQFFMSQFFVLDSALNAIDFTPRTRAIIDSAMLNFVDRFETIVIQGRTRQIIRNKLGQFTPAQVVIA